MRPRPNRSFWTRLSAYVCISCVILGLNVTVVLAKEVPEEFKDFEHRKKTCYNPQPPGFSASPLLNSRLLLLQAHMNTSYRIREIYFCSCLAWCAQRRGASASSILMAASTIQSTKAWGTTENMRWASFHDVDIRVLMCPGQ